MARTGLLVLAVLADVVGCVPLVADTLAASDAEASTAETSVAEMSAPPSDGGTEEVATAPDGPADARSEVCSNECESAAFRCSLAGVPQICLWNGMCSNWQNQGDCSDDHFCCDGACVPVDNSNCYACGKRCEGKTPTCDAMIRGCGCTSTLCAAKNLLCDPTTNECVDPPPGPTFWVDAEAPKDGADGTLSHPFKTITDALNAAASNAALADGGANGAGTTRISVAKGTYDSESFPIVLRGGISLEGTAGAGNTVIKGVGLSPLRNLATVVMGDTNRVNRISGFTLAPTAASTIDSPWGIWCDRGNAALAGAPPAVPNSEVKDMVFAGDYGTGIMVTVSAPIQTGGCNLRLTSSLVQARQVGLEADGCVGALSTQVVAAEIGDGTALGHNTFQIQSQTYGSGVSIGNCVSGLVVRNNGFSKANVGIHIEQDIRPQGDRNHFVIDDNTFDHLTGTGLTLVGGFAVVDELVGNMFSEITSSSGLPGVGVYVAGIKEDGFAKITKARNNTFTSNDVGVLVQSSYAYLPAYQAVDFGTSLPDDPGGNTFQCNSRPPAGGGIGGDVVIDLVPSGPVTLPFSGNLWDHDQPTHVSWNQRANGIDWTVSDDNIVLDMTSPTGLGMACGATRVQ